MRTWLVFLALLIHFSSGSSAWGNEHRSSESEKVRPREKADSSPDSWWDFWGLKKRWVDSYQDTISWNVDLVFGKKATDNFGQAILEFFFSPEGRQFVYQNKKTFLVNKLEETGSFEASFWKAFEEWLDESGYKKTLDGQLIPAVNLIPLQPRLNITAYYPQTPIRNKVARAVDHIQFLLADDMAQQMTGGQIAPGIIANAIRRASRGDAMLRSVQTSYNQSRNRLTDRIVKLIGVLATQLVQEGVKQRNLDVQVDFTVKGWESRPEFKTNPTFPIRSYFFAENEKKAIIPYQVTQFLDSLDTFNFEDEVAKFKKQQLNPR